MIEGIFTKSFKKEKKEKKRQKHFLFFQYMEFNDKITVDMLFKKFK